MGWRQLAAVVFSRQLWNRWDRLTQNPSEVQEAFLLQLIRRQKNTAFGKDHGFASIRTSGDFRRQVPLADYERFRPYVNRIAEGAENVLTSEPPLMFTLTSGTTAQPKLIPVTQTTLDIHTRLTRLWYCRAFLDHKKCFAGKVLGVVSPAAEGKTRAGTPYGAASGLIYRASPNWIKRALAAPEEVSEIKDFTAKYYVIMRLAVEQNIAFLGTPNPSTILKLVETADGFKEEIIKDVHDGTISDKFEISKEIRRALSARLSANRERAAELEKFIRAQGRLRPAEYWANLQLIGCWKGGTVGVRLHEFDRWFPERIPVRDLGYLASEAHVSLPICDDGAAGILAVDANYYEFIPEAKMDSPDAATLTCDQLQQGCVYYIAVTTAGGLYRYDINDLVRVTGFHRRTPLIEFLRKGRDVTNLTGEKLHVNQLIESVEESLRTLGVRARHYRACADIEMSRYAIAVEFGDALPNRDRLSQLRAEVDQHLSRLNIEYGQKRLSRRLGPPVLWIMKPGWSERQSALQRGARDTQFKARLLSHTLENPSEVWFSIEAREDES